MLDTGRFVLVARAMPERPILPKVDLAELAAELERKGAGGKGRRSKLALWLAENRAGFAQLLAEKEPSWNALAEALSARGLRNEANQPITGERLRKTWWSVSGPKKRKPRGRPGDRAPLPDQKRGPAEPAQSIDEPETPTFTPVRPK
jgi:hypothetical protein